MVNYRWNEEKNEWLKMERNITFNELVDCGEVLKIQKNTSSLHAEQLELHILYNNYVYKVPFVTEKDGTRFLKTAYKKRELNKLYNINNDRS